MNNNYVFLKRMGFSSFSEFMGSVSSHTLAWEFYKFVRQFVITNSVKPSSVDLENGVSTDVI